jgi:hypothetical protein
LYRGHLHGSLDELAGSCWQYAGGLDDCESGEVGGGKGKRKRERECVKWTKKFKRRKRAERQRWMEKR